MDLFLELLPSAIGPAATPTIVKTWISNHQNALNLGVLFFFGAVFTLKGIAGL